MYACVDEAPAVDYTLVGQTHDSMHIHSRCISAFKSQKSTQPEIYD